MTIIMQERLTELMVLDHNIILLQPLPNLLSSLSHLD